MADSAALNSLIFDLFKVDGLKFGNFTLKTGINSPFYVDLRVIVSYPEMLAIVSELMWDVKVKKKLIGDSICGVPYTALPIASCVTVNHKIPMLIRRKEAKDYGTKNLIEGRLKSGNKCIIIEDVVTSGSSVIETAQILRDAGLVVSDAIVFLDRCQGGEENLKKEGIALHKVTDVLQVLRVLSEMGAINEEQSLKVELFVKQNNLAGFTTVNPIAKLKMPTFGEKAERCENPVGRKLFQIMMKKHTNLALAADVDSSERLLKMAEDLGSYICILKTHVDILKDFTIQVGEKLALLAEKHNFLIMEDRKFSDIGATVQQQFHGGMHRIADWADIITVHSLSGPDVIRALKSAGMKKPMCCVLVAQMSSRGNLLNADYTKATVKMASENPDVVIGFISQSRLTDNPLLLHMTPGVNLLNNMDTLGQQYLNPTEAVVNHGADIIIVGRGITAVKDPLHITKSYRDVAWNAYDKKYYKSS